MRVLRIMAEVWFACSSTVCLAAPAPTTTPLYYSTTFTDPSGTPRSVSFTGTASGTSLTGTLTVNGAPGQVTATIGSDGSVSGTLLNPDDSKYGVFWGRQSGRSGMRRGSKGQVGDWSADWTAGSPTSVARMNDELEASNSAYVE